MTNARPIRVMIVDDHEMVRSGLSTFLQAFADLELVAAAENGEHALLLVERVLPDIVLMDLKMPVMDGPQAIRALLARRPETRVLALTSFKDDELVQQALQAGAMGYLLKDIDADRLAQAIRDAYAGRPTLAPEAAQALIRAARQPAALGHDLTEREREVLRLMVEGLSNPEIADVLVVGRSTVKSHVSSILLKLGADSRTEAVSLALQHRLVNPQAGGEGT